MFGSYPEVTYKAYNSHVCWGINTPELPHQHGAGQGPGVPPLMTALAPLVLGCGEAQR